jgi:phage terminase large subunit GpA-like protein
MSAGASGPLLLDRTPYMREILRAARDPEVEEMSLCFAAQSSKTLCCQIIVLFHLFEDQWPCLHVAPRETDAKSMSVDRYQAIINASPKLAVRVSPHKKDMTAEVIRIDGNPLNFAWSNSPASLASRSICILILDETDKYEMFSGREADPISLAKERTLTFSGRKIIKASTPTTETSYIWREFMEGDRRRFHVPCVHCGKYQILVMGTREIGLPGIKWPADVHDPEDVLDNALAWYECARCGDKLRDLDLPRMLAQGHWVPECQTIDDDGVIHGRPPPKRRLSYHLPRMYSPWANASYSHVAAEFLRSAHHTNKLMNFRNSWQAEIWQERVNELKDAHLRARRGAYRSGTVPDGAQIMTAGVDVQLDHLWYVIRAWGPNLESWLVRCGRCENFEHLHQILLQSQYFRGTGATRMPVPLRLVCIDCGFAERKDEVIWFSRLYSCQPIRGADNLKSSVVYGKITDTARNEHPLITLEVPHFKGRLHRMIKDSPPNWHLPADIDEQYYDQMTKEQRILEVSKRTGRAIYIWKKPFSNAANHLFDCEVYALAAAEVLDLEHILTETPKEASENVKAQKPEKEAVAGKSKGSFNQRFTKFNSRKFFSRS